MILKYFKNGMVKADFTINNKTYLLLGNDTNDIIRQVDKIIKEA